VNKTVEVMHMSEVTNEAMKRTALVSLVQKDCFVGWVYGIDYDTAKIMTNDLWKAQVNGIPHNSFLVATAFDPDRFSSAAPADQEVILLRVIGTCKLPQDDDLVRTRIDHFQRQKGIHPRDSDNDYDYDDLTRNQLQFGGLECRILGTFYAKEGELYLGSDLESFAVATSLSAYRPQGDALCRIVNHINPLQRSRAVEDARRRNIEKPIDPIRVGTVRYTSTDRLHRGQVEDLVPVKVQPGDFLARRTAVLGMTRTGKSNLVKTVVSVVHGVAKDAGVNIGQIIYDINGEYANINQQDKGSIADVFTEDTKRYSLSPIEGFEDLRNNFYEQISEGFATISRDIQASGKSTSNYIQAFLSMSLDEPDKREVSEHKRWLVKTAAYKALLKRAGFEPPDEHRVKFSANKDVMNAVNGRLGGSMLDPTRGLSLEEAVAWFTEAREANKTEQLPSSTRGKFWVDEDLEVLLNMLVQKGPNDSFISGYQILAPSRPYHSPKRISDVASEVYEHLKNGRIVILDLSLGDAVVKERISKRIASEIFFSSMKAFTDGKIPPTMQVYVEEAHNLLGKDLDLTDVWPRLAKEGAKYGIGLVYATQEVSSINKNILANTENWFVSHLNNDNEIRELSKFYDFSDFSKSLIRAQDVGFTRVKTLSSPFVVPVQIDLFKASSSDDAP